MTDTPHLTALSRTGRKFLGTKHAILGGAMSWISERNLVSAISNAGGFGVIASGSMPPEKLDEEIEATKKLTDAPFGVNLITLHPQLNELIAVCAKKNVSHVVLAGSLPPGKTIRALKDKGIKVLCFAPAATLAKKLIRSGADALVVEGSEAGGHIGPVSTSVLVQEILPVTKDTPVFVAGGIGRGEMIASYLEMGAAGCQLGTRFVVATECVAHPDFKKVFIRANARDAVSSFQVDSRFPVIPVRAISNRATEAFLDCQKKAIEKFQKGTCGQKAAQLEIEHFWAGALRRAVIEGDVENGSLMAGQSVGTVKREEPMADIFHELTTSAEAALEYRAKLLT